MPFMKIWRAKGIGQVDGEGTEGKHMGVEKTIMIQPSFNIYRQATSQRLTEYARYNIVQYCNRPN
jgi:hypothetical protein